ncbi:WD repeat protein JIP5, putative [Rhizoctonia solani AG-3 Rhs1AP]|uniref:WD repeat-containing protein JIP5 n=2 Tax=Rhizoctonia solani AG-3 TaxID=1086053 RepID=A0A074RHM1_9AGAM|nr:WD repeat protein JIP5, putative [Rhizoctonia solani AG-3 Rhs1AP]KEP46621.1 WD repeat protein JIP5 [Rhizoctonia solani 123E]
MKFGLMPDVDLGTQVFDLAFNPKHDIVYTGLLSGHVKAFAYDDEGICTPKFDIRPAKRTARSLATDSEGLELYSVSKDRSIHVIDTSTGKLVREQAEAHESAINCVTRFMSMLATGDDNGVIKLWDPRQISPIRSYTHHFDFISDFLWFQDKKQLVVTSGDGTLSVVDVRSSKVEPFAQSEDQDDELLSLVSIKDGKKVAVGTQTGIISIWDRGKGWGDCVDRMKGHPHSVDALAKLSEDVIVTGSSDGLVRVVQVLPNKLLGVIADHGTFPIERLRTDRNGAWLGSASHDNVLKLTDVRDALADSDEEDPDEGGSDDSNEEEGEGKDSIDDDSDSGSGQSDEEPAIERDQKADNLDSESESKSDKADTHADSGSESESQPEPVMSKKRKKKSQPEEPSSKKGKLDDGFFDEL